MKESPHNVLERCKSLIVIRSQFVAASNTAADLARHRKHLDSILASRAFASSKQISTFLRFVAEKSLSGESHLTQEEIAEHVLGKGHELDASYDSVIRKLASMTRQRLGRYYVEEGAADDVELALPLRSYLPVFRPREPGEIVPEPHPQQRTWPRFAAVGAILVLAGVPIIVYFRLATPEVADSVAWSLKTVRGDLAYQGADAPPSSVLLGDAIRNGNALTALLHFQPEHEAQQAGILLWKDADNYVRFGRSFTARNYLEFVLERAGEVRTAPENLVYDTEGQSGKPVWLALWRNGTRFHAFVSSDGSDWTSFGAPIDLPELGEPRIGIYAYHGRREPPATVATFRQVSTELWFAGSEETLRQRLQASCAGELTTAERAPFLSIRLLDAQPACSAVLRASQMPAGDWIVESRIDSIGVPGAMAGLYVAGAKGRVRLIRYGTDQPSVSLMHDLKSVQTLPDYNGSPPVTLSTLR